MKGNGTGEIMYFLAYETLPVNPKPYRAHVPTTVLW